MRDTISVVLTRPSTSRTITSSAVVPVTPEARVLEHVRHAELAHDRLELGEIPQQERARQRSR